MAGTGAQRVVILGALGACGVALWSALTLGHVPSQHARSGEPARTGDAASAAPAQPKQPSTHVHDTRPASSPPTGSAVPLDSQASDQARAQLARQALEQRMHNDARYRELAARWANETRDEPWSTDQERALRNAASGSGLDHLLFELECRRTLCRVELSAADSNTAFTLQRAHAFTALLGADTGSTMIGAGPDRALQTFAARDGMGSPKGP